MIGKNIGYFPHINLPAEGDWIKAAILYWDKIGIVSHKFNTGIFNQNYPFEGVTRELAENNNGKIELIHREEYLTEDAKQHFIKLCEKSGTSKRPPLKCYLGKFDKELKKALITLGKAEENNGWLFVDSNIATLYLSLLAYNWAEKDGYDLYTDRKEFLSEMQYIPPDHFNKKVFKSTEYTLAVLREVLPVPKRNVSVNELIQFRKDNFKAYAELKLFLQTEYDLIKDLDTVSLDRFMKVNEEIKKYVRANIDTLLIKKFGDTLPMSSVMFHLSGASLCFKVLNALFKQTSSKEFNSAKYMALVHSTL